MKLIIKSSLTFSLFLILCLYSASSQAATLIVENNTNLTLDIYAKGKSLSSNEKLIGIVPPVTEKRINIDKGYWDVIIEPVVPSASTDNYPILTRTFVINSDTDVKSIVLVDKDFGKTTIAGPPCSSSMNGKYSNLLKRILVAKDKSRYGKCHDYGYWGNTSYAGYKNLPKGYWVYVHPDWYIWGSTKNAPTTSGCDTTMGGKYSNKLRTLSVPKDVSSYGKCHDYGYWGNTSYAGYKNLPKGFWVYDAPNWIIYGNKN